MLFLRGCTSGPTGRARTRPDAKLAKIRVGMLADEPWDCLRAPKFGAPGGRAARRWRCLEVVNFGKMMVSSHVIMPSTHRHNAASSCSIPRQLSHSACAAPSRLSPSAHQYEPHAAARAVRQWRQTVDRSTKRPTVTAAVAPSACTSDPATHYATGSTTTLDVLDWLVYTQGAQPYQLKVDRRQLPGLDSGLVALSDVEPGEVILSVPLPRAISSEQCRDEARWSIAMAAQLLQLQAAGSAAPWLAALPPPPPLPWLGWSDDALEELQDGDTIAEAEHMRRVLEQACAELGPSGYSREQVAWALAMVHSRSFIMGEHHVWVPGIDCCNHRLEANASVRCVHSPGTCQGLAATEEVCPPSAADTQPSRFELVAGEEGLRAGEEVCISYGSWSSDVFLLFFGFVPESNPHEAAVLFAGLEDLVAFWRWWQQASGIGASSSSSSNNNSRESSSSDGRSEVAGNHGQQQSEEHAVEQAVQLLEAELGPRHQFYRLVVTAGGFDARLLQVAEAMQRRAAAQPADLSAFLAACCREALAAWPTSLQEDEHLLQQVSSSASSPGADLQAMAIRYRMGKKSVLQVALQAIEGR